MKKLFFIKLAVFFLPIFLVWFFLSGKVIVPLAVGINELWVEPAYSHLGVELVQNEEQEWRAKTRLFQATKPYAHNSHQPQLSLDGATWVEFGDFKSLTLCLPLFWLLVLAFKPGLKSFFVGSACLFLLVVFMAGLNLFYKMTNSLIDGGEMLRVLKSGYVFVPDRPPGWLPKVLKPLVDASFNLLVLAAPVAIWLMFYWQELKQELSANKP